MCGDSISDKWLNDISTMQILYHPKYESMTNSQLQKHKKQTLITITISRAGRIPNFAKVLKKASLFWGCSVWENAQNSLKKLTCEVKVTVTS